MELQRPTNDVLEVEETETAAETVVTEAAEETATEETQPSVITIAVTNPSAEEMQVLVDTIKANYDFEVDVVSTRFGFKKSTDKETQIETNREAVELAVPYPSKLGIAEALATGGLQAELVQEAVNSMVNEQVRALLNDGEEGRKLNAATFPVDKLSWDFISKLPKPQRGAGIAKEIWEAFIKDYATIMPAASGRSIEKIAAQTKILANKFSQSKTKKAVLEFMLTMLNIYVENSENAADFVDCVTFLLSKIDTFLNYTEEDMLENL